MTAAFGGRILDTTALLDVGTGATFYTRSLVDTATTSGLTLAVPAAALAVAWARAAPAGRLFLDLFLDLAVVVVDPVDAPVARAVGAVLASSHGPFDTGQVVVSARARGWAVVTADPAPLRALAPEVDIESLP